MAGRNACPTACGCARSPSGANVRAADAALYRGARTGEILRFSSALRTLLRMAVLRVYEE